MKYAIIVIDMLEDFFQEGRLREHRSNLVAHTNELTAFARQHNIPVIWVRQEFKADLSDAFLAMRKHHHLVTIENTKGCQILKELHRESGDYEVIKKRYSAFFRTNLDMLLTKLNINALIICGVNTHACVRMAAIDAYQRDYEVILATDCIDSYDKEHHSVSLKYLTREIASGKTNQEILRDSP
ncbi:MAG TPA: isochorismatase family cysteine hydrolase [Candidatus Saccharimonadales bacterium]|nr:isochorismatase family cysteine hydrolase [Candidatus Saccharimonadales bacterium]